MAEGAEGLEVAMAKEIRVKCRRESYGRRRPQPPDGIFGADGRFHTVATNGGVPVVRQRENSLQES